MRTEIGAALISRYYDGLANERDAPRRAVVADEILTQDFVFHAPNDVDGKVGLDQHKQWQEWHHRVAPDQNFVIEELVVTADRGATRWRARATHRHEFLGIPATGREFITSGLDLFHLREDKISELWRAFDLRTVVAQLTATAPDR